MNIKRISSVAVLLLTIVSGNALAQDDDLDATMRVISSPDGTLPEAVTKEISLPNRLLNEDAPTAEAAENSEFGLTTAEENRDAGVAHAEEAFERAAEMAGQAQENAENHSRAGDAPDPPTPPDVPQPPTPPGGG